MITRVAVIVVLPGETPLPNPAPLIVATSVDDELHMTRLVRSSVLPPLKWPVAVNCRVFPATIEGFVGATLMEMSPLIDAVGWPCANAHEPGRKRESKRKAAARSRLFPYFVDVDLVLCK
jgi:hypothetical protein